MNFHDYQEKAHSTSLNTKIADNEFLYPLLGLCDETGEVFGKVKKLFRDKDGKLTEQFLVELEAEFGDVLWYLSESCTKFGISLNKVAEGNLEKLFSRKERNTIQGSGDDR